MENINKVIGQIVSAVKVDPSLPTKTTTALPAPWTPSPKANSKEIVAEIRRVELLKQLRPALTDQQVAELALELTKQGWTVARLREKGESVALRDTFGTIALQYWLADSILTEEQTVAERQAVAREHAEMVNEFQLRVDRYVRDRIATLKLNLTEEARERDREIAELAALEDEAARWSTLRMDYEQRIRRELHAKMKRYSATLKAMPVETRRAVFAEAVQRGLLKDFDDAMIGHAHLFPDKLAPVLEDWGKQPA